MPDLRPPSARRTLLLLLGLMLVVKGVFVVALADVFFYGEELEKGTVAKALIDGVAIPYSRLPYHAYEGGGFVVSHLKALAFLAVGENVLAHKLVGLATCGLVLAAAYLFTRRHFGAGAALVLGLLFVFGPLSFQKLSILSLGIHFEALFFALVILDRATRLIRGDDTRVSDVVVLGLASGFGTYFSYQTVIVVGWAGLLLLWKRRDVVFGRLGLVGLASFAVGLLPLLAMAVAVGRDVIDIHGASLGGAGDAVDRISRFLRSSVEGGDPIEVALAWVWPLAALASLGFAVSGLERESRARLVPLVGYAVLWTIAYVNSGFIVEAVYHSSGQFMFFNLMRFAPIWLVGLVLLSVVLASVLEREGGVRRLACGGLLLLFALGIRNTLQIVAGGRPATPGANLDLLLHTKGYEYGGYFAKLWDRLEGDERDKLRLFLTFDEEDPGLLYGDAAATAFEATSTPYGEARALLAEIDPDGLEEFTLGLGSLIAGLSGHALDKALAASRGLEGRERELFAEAVGRFGADWAISRERIEQEVEWAVGEPGTEAFLRGVGWRVFRMFVVRTYGGPDLAMKPGAARAWLESLDPEAAEHLVEGFDAALAGYSLE